MNTYTYNLEGYFGECFQTFTELRKSEKTCDIAILTSNKKINAHKLVLASASQYFKHAIYGLFLNDSSKNQLELHDIQYDILLVIVDYIYTGKMEINLEIVFDLYKAADYCMMNYVKIMCLEFMHENLNVDNCVKFWIMANNCKYEKLSIDAANIIFLNLEIATNMSEFLNLSNEEILDLLGLWPTDKLFDSIISAALKWAADKELWEDTLIKMFKDMSFTRISDDYLENFLSKNELVQKSFSCNKWMMNIYKEKSKLYNLKLSESESELKFTRFLLDRPILFMSHTLEHSGDNNFYKYIRRDGTSHLFNKIKCSSGASDCKTYKKWIYLVGVHDCKRFAFDDSNNKSESVFNYNHGGGVKAAVLNESIYFFGGVSSLKNGSSIDLNTKQCTSFNLSYKSRWSGIAVNDGSIYVCGGLHSNVVQRFDPREGKTKMLGSIDFDKPGLTYAASLRNQIYCSHINAYKMMDIRINNKWVEIKPPVKDQAVHCLFSSYGGLYTVLSNTIYEYNASESWDTLHNLKNCDPIWLATSFD